MTKAETKVALVTGAANGIGAAISEQLARDGFTVLVSDMNEAEAGRTAARFRQQGFDAHPLALDVSSPDSIIAAFAMIRERYGRCDVIVNNAGVAQTFPFLEFPLESFLATMAVNVTGALLCAQHAARLMVPRGWGRIINIASVAGMRSVGQGRTAYGISKAAVIGLTRQIASELAQAGITANAVAPGPVDTPMTEVLHSAEFRRIYTNAVPMKRYGKPSEIADIVSFLASDRAAYITGVTIPVDGGFMATGALS